MRRNTIAYSVTLLCSHHFSMEKLIATAGRDYPSPSFLGQNLPLPAPGSHWAPGALRPVEPFILAALHSSTLTVLLPWQHLRANS